MNFVFIHIPKTGGETVLQALETRKWDFLCNRFLSGKGARFLFHPAYAKHASLQEVEKEITAARQARVLAVVRNPYQRLYSLYNHLRRWEYDPRYNNQLPNPQFAAGFAAYYDFNAWVHFVLMPDFPSLENVRQSNPIDHFKPMTDYLKTDQDTDRICVLRLENLEDDFTSYMADSNLLHGALAQKNASRGGKRGKEDPIRLLDDDARALVASYYEVDFRRFGYAL